MLSWMFLTWSSRESGRINALLGKSTKRTRASDDDRKARGIVPSLLLNRARPFVFS